MIAIKRTAAPGFLSDPKKKWYQEDTRIIEHYKYAPHTADTFKFGAYNDDALKNELRQVFFKCAYCDSNYSHVYDGDIEHYRPKGRVFGKTPAKPGYYWLANNWDNLLLACQHCNQERKHEVYCTKTKEKFGKADHFPLSDETKRVTAPDQSFADEDEVRLLINPCIDNPEKHFEYDKETGIIIWLTEMGEKSVDTYALQRPYLVQQRQKQLAIINYHIGKVRKALDDLLEDDSDEKNNEYETEYAVLKKYTAKESDYAGMARFMIRLFLEEIENI